MARQTKRKQAEPTTFPILKTVEQMSKISGIGENRLRQLMDNGELEYIQNGNRRLLTDEAIWDWYDRMKCPAVELAGRHTNLWQFVNDRSKTNGTAAASSQGSQVLFTT